MKDPTLGPLYKKGLGNEHASAKGSKTYTEQTLADFFEVTNIPKDRKITGKLVCDHKPHKAEKERVRLTVGGDILDYSGDVATFTADITTFKILINSNLSTEDA
jgi:hypothetical protein